jgi:acetylglutamate/LysW-gamma-L-alpha-aminoadipate kinase
MLIVKIGGSIADRCPELLDEIAHRRDVVLVHGFGPQATQLGEARGTPPRFVTSPTGVRSRFTDAPTMAVLRDAGLAVGRDLANGLARRGCKVHHVAGDAGVLLAEVKPVLRDVTADGRVLMVRGNRSGTVRAVRETVVRDALAAGEVPVVTPIASDEAGPVSVDGDRAAAALAVAVDAEALVLLTDVQGYLARFPDASSRVPRVARADIDALLGTGAKGGMVRKLVACREALDGCVGRAVLASGLVERPIERALAGEGTEVTP